MRRAFASLYFIIVAAIVLIGWGMDVMWDAYNPEPKISSYEKSLLSLLEKQLDILEKNQLEGKIEELNRDLDVVLSIYSLDELASTDLGESIVHGESVLVRDQRGATIIYRRVNEGPFVLALKQLDEPNENSSLYFFFLILFYLGLALVIYIWVWPLSRDLNRLEKQTRLVGKDGAAAHVEFHRSSHVQALADAFNSMSVRIKELLASRKEMTYAVSHELRTPLARMKFALEMAAETENAQLMREQLLSVREDVNALDKFVNELLNYASFDQSIQRLEMEEGDILAFCHSIVAELTGGDTQINVICASETVKLNCDWQLMDRALTNLIQNAQRYANKQIRLELIEQENQCLLAVEDDGPGIPEADREKAFQSFVRLESGKKVTKGYGLGLAIVKRIIQWHGGSVSIETSSLGGARFVISLPQTKHLL